LRKKQAAKNNANHSKYMKDVPDLYAAVKKFLKRNALKDDVDED
jgi:hypothetical protein